MKIVSCMLILASWSSVCCYKHKITGINRQLNPIKLEKDLVEWQRNNIATIIPILTDIACEACSKISDKKDREKCSKKFCLSSGTHAMRHSIDVSIIKRKIHIDIFGNKGLPVDKTQGVIAELTNMLCSLCSKIKDPVKKKKCITKFCLKRSLSLVQAHKRIETKPKLHVSSGHPYKRSSVISKNAKY
ncbi:Hypothetical predicted protein [Mytilus galloprovincialis]|uniref:Uncharacterized protein n=1 Tax=Mytilus galloprovincialis TaxID=29158 RepID=A0A8B6BUQ6_MYTGA|nr:Hypothetical predicted protein [Mytilus galloprovincialis]